MDDQQADLFGAVPQPAPPKLRPTRQPRPAPAPALVVEVPPAPANITMLHPPPASPAEPEPDPATLAARLSPADLEDLAAALPDDALARPVLAAVRQLRRCLSRGIGRSAHKPSPALDRAARQLAAELRTGDDAS